RNGKLQLLSHLLPPRSDSASADFESGMQKTGNDEVWFSYANSILSLKKNEPAFSCTTIYTLPVKDHITTLFYNTTGQLWIGTIDGVWLFEKNNSLQTKPTGQHISLPHSYVKNINQHPD